MKRSAARRTQGGIVNVHRRSIVTAAAGAALVVAMPAAEAIRGPANHPAKPPVSLQIIADHRVNRQYQDIGFTVSVANHTKKAVDGVRLSDRLPAGGNLSWALDKQSGVGGCVLSGAVGAQRLACPSTSLEAGQSYAVHLYSHTTSSTERNVSNVATVNAPEGGGVTRSASLSVVAQPDCRTATPDPSRAMEFDDEFDGSTIDTSKWNVGSLPFAGLNGSTHYHNQQYGSYVEAKNSVVKHGVLNLTSNDTPVTNPDVPSIGTIPYTEGMVNTKGKFTMTGGYVEMCAKFPSGKGLWPAFWMGAQSGQWPPEMDIAEWFGSLEALQIGQPWATGPAPIWQTAGSRWLSTWRYSSAPTTAYHDYAMWWAPGSPGTIRYYIDGQMVHEVDGTTSDLIADTPMYLILNSGTWAPSTRGGPPDATTVFPNDFRVDYVRAYKAAPAQQANSAP
jgi:beta-glucanase (GH16 family)